MRRRSFKPAQCLVIALVAVVVLDPLASLDMGFWLSYGAVAILMLAFSGRYATRPHLPGQRLFEAQWAVFIGLLVPLAVLLNSHALLAPVANVLAKIGRASCSVGLFVCFGDYSLYIED